MGGAIGAGIQRIAQLGDVDGLSVEGAEVRSEFNTDSVFVTIPGETVLPDSEAVRPGDDELSFLYVEPLDETWVSETETTVGIFTTPTSSIDEESLNPLAHVSAESFVTESGGDYLAESGLGEQTGLGSDLSWVVTPEEVASRSTDVLGASTTLASYLGVVEDGDGAIRTVLAHVAKVELDDEIAFGTGIQHRELWTDASEDEAQALVDELSAQSVSDLVGTDEAALVGQSAVETSADTVERLLSSATLDG